MRSHHSGAAVALFYNFRVIEQGPVLPYLEVTLYLLRYRAALTATLLYMTLGLASCESKTVHRRILSELRVFFFRCDTARAAIVKRDRLTDRNHQVTPAHVCRAEA
jgi:hypothetical protein